MNLARDIRKGVQEHLEKGEKHYQAGDDAAAAKSFEVASRLLFKLAEYAPSRTLEESHKRRGVKYRKLARRLRSGDIPRTTSERARTSQGGDGADAPSEVRQAAAALMHASNVTWDEIGGLEDTKREIKFTLGLSLAKPPPGIELAPWRNILFYGPPGTGKTLLAAATSNAMRLQDGQRAVFFNVKVSSILSKYFGESSKILSEVYGTARDTSPAVVFLDEFESLCPSREKESTGAERRLLSTLLAELDGLSEKGRSDLFVLTIAATNRPWDRYAAVLSRFEKKILIPLPDADSRRAILDIHLTKRGFETDAPWPTLVHLTSGYTGRELERFAKEVTNRMIGEMNGNVPGLVDQGLDAVRSHQLQVRRLTLADFKQAAGHITPQVTADEIKRYQDWHRAQEE